MLKARPAGNKNLPIACGRTTLGDDLSYGVFEEATFQAKKAIELNGTDLAHADVSSSKLTVTAENNDVLNQAFTPMVGLPRTTGDAPAPPPALPEVDCSGLKDKKKCKIKMKKCKTKKQLIKCGKKCKKDKKKPKCQKTCCELGFPV